MKTKTTTTSSPATTAGTAPPPPLRRSLVRIREYEEDPSINTGTAWREFIIRTDGSSSSNNDSTSTNTTIFHHHITIVFKMMRRWLHAPLSVAKDLFLPLGYPATVRHGYLEYQVYDSVQGLCSYLRSVLCSAQVLSAAGVGNDQATALGAALAWAHKDGAGMLGGLCFSYLASPHFDGHVKEFRLFADVVNDVAMTLDMLAPYVVYGISGSTGGTGVGSVGSFGNYYRHRLLIISSLSTLCKTMCGMSAGATKASITQYFAIEGNMADLNATESTQETLMSLVGMLLGVTLASRLNDYESSHSQHLIMPIQWTIFTLLTLIHVWANYKGVALLRLLTLNRERTEVILKRIIIQQQQQLQEQQQNHYSKNHADHNKSNSSIVQEDDEAYEQAFLQCIPKPTQVFESMWASTCKMLWPGRQFSLNARLTDLVTLDATLLEDPLEHENNYNNRYVLVLVGNGPLKQRRILVSLLAGANNQDELQAFCHAFYLRHVLLTTKKHLPSATSSMLQNRALVQAAATAIQPWFEAKKKKKKTSVHYNDDAADDDGDYDNDAADGSGGSSSTSCNPSRYGVLMRALVRQGWDVHGRLYLGFSRRRSQWTRTKDD